MPWTNFMNGIYMLLFLITGAVVYKIYTRQASEQEEKD